MNNSAIQGNSRQANCSNIRRMGTDQAASNK